MPMNILVTGASGFVGRAIAESLREGNRVLGVGRREVNDCSFEYFRSDITDASSLSTVGGIMEPDVIVHAAAAVSRNNMDKTLIDTNIRGTENILSFARKTGCKKIIYISSAPVIGVPIENPITENHKVYPLTTYHLTKYFSELLLRNAPDIETVVLRLPSPVGAAIPRNKIFAVLISNCLSGVPIRLLGKGGRMQNYINVKDIGTAVMKAASSEATGIYNVAYPKSYSNLELAQLCKKTLNSKSKIDFYGEDPEEDMKWVYSCDKIRKELGFSPSVTIEESIREVATSIANENRRH